MKFKKVQEVVLQLLNRQTVAGTTVAPSYNCQADYLQRIPDLVNDAMLEIATTVCKIPETLELANLTPKEYGTNYVRYKLPEDMYELKTGGVLCRGIHGGLHPVSGYRLQGREYILIPIEDEGEYILEYYRYPHLLPDRPDPEEELDNIPITHTAIPFYVAAFLVIHDDPFQYATFYNKYEDKLVKMTPGLRTEVHSIEDVYDSMGGVV